MNTKPTLESLSPGEIGITKDQQLLEQRVLLSALIHFKSSLVFPDANHILQIFFFHMMYFPHFMDESIAQ